MNTTELKPVPKRSLAWLSILFIALVILVIIGADVWYHLGRPKDDGKAMVLKMKVLETEAARTSNQMAELRKKLSSVDQLTSQVVATSAAISRREAELDALRADLERCRKQVGDASAALANKSKQVEVVSLSAKEREAEIARLRQRVTDLENDLRARIEAEATNAAVTPTPVVKPPDDSGTKLPGTPEIGANEPPAAKQRWSDKPGFPGVCRGVARVVCAPLVVPYGAASGVAASLGVGEQTQGTNTLSDKVGAVATAPLAIAVGSVAGAGGCVVDTLSGTADICTMGYYGVRDKEFTGNTDDRPAIAQLLDREEPARVVTVEEDQTKPRAGVRGQQTVSFSLH